MDINTTEILDSLRRGFRKGFALLDESPMNDTTAVIIPKGSRFVMQSGDRTWTSTRRRDLVRRARQHGLTIAA